MPIPDQLKPIELYRELPMPANGWPDRETPRALRKSLDKAHDNLKLLLKENNELRGELIEFHRKQRRWLKVLLACLGFLTTAIGSIFAWLIPYAVHGMAK